jgi:hypothetical protein
MEYKICFYRGDGSKRLYLLRGQSYEIILKKYFKNMEKKSYEWLIGKFGALYTDEQTFEKKYTVYQQGDLFNEITN